ncbi:MAG: polyhydroxyalkanoate depolymerase [Burkholderiaceae bacterium]|nr:MAG: polyhydroxyalkanoate depolymerase [Burkholderiaceae bacterium]
MLYQLHEFNRAFLTPLTRWAETNAQLLRHPYSLFAYLPFSHRAAAGYELLYRLGKQYGKPEFNIHNVVVDGTTVTVSEEVVLEKSFCRLLHFKRHFTASQAKRKPDPAVLIFAPLSGHHATLLRDTVRTLLQEHDVYITEWIDARLVPLSEGPFHLHDYVHYCIEFIQLLGPNLHLISVCQPTVPVLAAVSLMASNKDPHLPKSMTMMGGPIDARCSPTAVNTLASEKPYSWFENHVVFTVPHNYPGYLRRVYPGFLQHTGFVAMNPDRHLQSHWDFYLHLVEGDGESADAHRQFYDEYNAVLDLPAEYYLDTIKTVFQEFALPEGTWFVGDQRVAPEDIKNVALFTIEGELDDISGSGQTEAAHALCKNIPSKRKQHFTAPKCGHYGIFSGRRWREVVYPRIKDFIQKHE